MGWSETRKAIRGEGPPGRIFSETPVSRYPAYLAFTVRREDTLISVRSGSHDEWATSPLFCWRRLECTADRLWSGSLCVDLEKIRGAAERVARSEGLEIVDVEWKVGKQRFLRVYIDRMPKSATLMSDAAGEMEA